MNIIKCLESVSGQDYPANLFEIIMVDDHSTDKTKEIAENFLSPIKIPYKCISNREKSHGKKSAISEAIKNSIGELIVITDADCYANKTWLSSIENEYQKSNAYMICGPVQIIVRVALIGQFQSLELCGLSLLSGAGIKAGLPLLCNGANIAYTRKVFDDVEGFKGIDRNPSGDDILLMFKVHNLFPDKVSYLKSKEAIVSTLAQPSLKDFISQRIRWASKRAFILKIRLTVLVSLCWFSAQTCYLLLQPFLFSFN